MWQRRFFFFTFLFWIHERAIFFAVHWKIELKTNRLFTLVDLFLRVLFLCIYCIEYIHWGWQGNFGEDFFKALKLYTVYIYEKNDWNKFSGFMLLYKIMNENFNFKYIYKIITNADMCTLNRSSVVSETIANSKWISF